MRGPTGGSLMLHSILQPAAEDSESVVSIELPLAEVSSAVCGEHVLHMCPLDCWVCHRRRYCGVNFRALFSLETPPSQQEVWWAASSGVHALPLSLLS